MGQGKLEVMSASLSEKLSRSDGYSVPLAQKKYPLLLSGLIFEPHSPAAGRAERRLSVMSQSWGTGS